MAKCLNHSITCKPFQKWPNAPYLIYSKKLQKKVPGKKKICDKEEMKL